jgi:hypothetical protein
MVDRQRGRDLKFVLPNVMLVTPGPRTESRYGPGVIALHPCNDPGLLYLRLFPIMNIRAIVEQLQKDLTEMPRVRIKKLPKGTELKFIRGYLHVWGYELSEEKIQALAMRAESYDEFILSAMK